MRLVSSSGGRSGRFSNCVEGDSLQAALAGSLRTCGAPAAPRGKRFRPLRMPALISLLLMLASAPGLAAEKLFRYDCGGAQVEIRGTYDASDPGCFSFHKFDLSVARATRRVSLDLSSGFMHAACIKDSKGRAMIVFQQYCDGSGCHDLDNYGIVDPRTLNIVLEPTDTNREVAARTLGLRKAPVLLDYPETLCCSYCNE